MFQLLSKFDGKTEKVCLQKYVIVNVEMCGYFFRLQKSLFPLQIWIRMLLSDAVEVQISLHKSLSFDGFAN